MPSADATFASALAVVAATSAAFTSLSVSTRATTCTAAAARATGVGAAPVKQFVDGLFGGVYSAYGERMLNGTYWKMEEPLFSADNARKDIGHARDVARAAGVELKHAAVIDEHLQVVADHAGGDKGDVAGIYGAVRKNAGLKYENDA